MSLKQAEMEQWDAHDGRMSTHTCCCGSPATIPPDYCADCFRRHTQGFNEAIAIMDLQREADEILTARTIERLTNDR